MRPQRDRLTTGSEARDLGALLTDQPPPRHEDNMLTHNEIDRIQAAIPHGGLAVLEALKTLPLRVINYDVRTTIWSAAMTLAYGHGLHHSQRHADGTPLPETLAMPEVQDAMARAAKRMAIAIDTARREAR
jgi:hypothetical protein